MRASTVDHAKPAQTAQRAAQDSGLLHPRRGGILSDVSRARTHDFEKLSREYAGRWVAIDPATDAVVAAGETAREVADRARSLGIAIPFIAKIQKEYEISVACR